MASEKCITFSSVVWDGAFYSDILLARSHCKFSTWCSILAHRALVLSEVSYSMESYYYGRILYPCAFTFISSQWYYLS